MHAAYSDGRRELSVCGVLTLLIQVLFIRAGQWTKTDAPPRCVVSCDVESAFDRAKPGLAAEALLQSGTPAIIVAALLEVMRDASSIANFEGLEIPIKTNKAIQQGGVESGMQWKMLLQSVLGPLVCSHLAMLDMEKASLTQEEHYFMILRDAWSKCALRLHLVRMCEAYKCMILAER
jgi:hypothetical protein